MLEPPGSCLLPAPCAGGSARLRKLGWVGAALWTDPLKPVAAAMSQEDLWNWHRPWPAGGMASLPPVQSSKWRAWLE